MAQGGFDSVTVDLQHGVQDYLSMVACFQAMQAHPVLPMVRVPWNEPGIIGKVAGRRRLRRDLPDGEHQGGGGGAGQLHANTRPMGKRSNGPIRAGIYGAATGYQSDGQRRDRCASR